MTRFLQKRRRLTTCTERCLHLKIKKYIPRDFTLNNTKTKLDVNFEKSVFRLRNIYP